MFRCEGPRLQYLMQRKRFLLGLAVLALVLLALNYLGGDVGTLGERCATTLQMMWKFFTGLFKLT
jgi:hypothetical protein